MTYMNELSIIIVNYKNYSLTIKCINSVIENLKSVDYEIIVCDNASPNESYDELSKKFGDIDNIKIIKNGSNAGFGAANNLCVEKSQGKYILFLNPDVVVLDDAIEKMLYKIKSNDKVGAISGKLLNDDYTIQYSCRRVLPLGQFILVRTPLSKLMNKKKKEYINDMYLMKDFDHNSEKSVDWVMGACILMRKDEFIELGGFSKEYFMYFEDVDLCCKVRKSGKDVIYLPEAKMLHLHNQESTKKINKMTVIHLQSMIKFYYKYYTNKI